MGMTRRDRAEHRRAVLAREEHDVALGIRSLLADFAGSTLRLAFIYVLLKEVGHMPTDLSLSTAALIAYGEVFSRPHVHTREVLSYMKYRVTTRGKSETLTETKKETNA